MEKNVQATPESPVSGQKAGSHKLKDFLKTIGPAVITVFSWLGAGDIISSAVSGSTYGYALMWILVISFLIRFVIVNTMTRFELMNIKGGSMVEAFASISKIYPIFLGIAALVMGNLTIGYILKGAGQSLGWFLGFGPATMWSGILAVIIVLLLGRSVFAKLESIFKIFLAVLVAVFIALAIYCQPDPAEIVRGTFLFQLPESSGTYDVMLVVLGLVGATAGSLANLFHGINLSEGGVRNPEDMKGQTKSLLFSVVAGAILVLCVWIVGADILRPNGIEVNSLQDIGSALELYLGVVGAKIFYLGVFGALFSAAASSAIGFGKLAIANLNELMPSRKGRYEKFQYDKIYPIVVIGLMATAFIWSLPAMPGQVYMTLFVNSLNVVIVPAIACGVLYVTNSKKFMGENRNNLFENIVLAATTILAVVSVFKTFF